MLKTIDPMSRFTGVWLALLMVLFAGTSLISPPEAWCVMLQGGVSQTNVAPVAQPESEYGIIGVDLEIRLDSFTRIGRVFPGTPAARAGLRSGDSIVSINGLSTLGLSREEVDAIIPHHPKSQVQLVILRAGKRFGIALKPQPIEDFEQQSFYALYNDIYP